MGLNMSLARSWMVAIICGLITTLALVSYLRVAPYRELSKYDGPYKVVTGTIEHTKYAGREELFGPQMLEVKLKGGHSYVLVFSEKAPMAQVGDVIVLELPTQLGNSKIDGQVTNRFRIVTRE